jgi:lysophospholipase L1-like esterase
MDRRTVSRGRRNIVVLAAACLILLALLEIGYRAFIVIRKPIHKPSSVPGLGWELTPGARFRDRRKDGSRVTEYLINSEGFRDGTTGPWEQWDAGDTKIVFLGDSVVYGVHVNHQDLFSTKLASMLTAPSRKVRVINAGIKGTNTLQHFALLKHKILAYDPDIVILAYFINDIERRAFSRLPPYLQYFLRQCHFGKFVVSRIAQKITSMKNYLWSQQNEVRARGGRLRSWQEIFYDYSKETVDAYETGWDGNRRVIESMNRLCRQNGIAFGIVCFPFENQLWNKELREPQKRLAELCREEQIPFLDLTEEFTYMEADDLYIERDWSHLDKPGHRVAGEIIAEWILSEPDLNNRL